MKYNNKICYQDGYKFGSLREREYYIVLKLLKERKQIIAFDLQPKFEYTITYSAFNGSGIMTQKAKYIADFRVFHNDGTITVEDVKGFETAIFKRKKRIMKKLFNIDVKLIK
jgi:hypothetical protein